MELLQAAHALADRYSVKQLRSLFDKPVVILSAPRSGSTLLYETLAKSEDLWSIGRESHVIFSLFPELHASKRGYASGRLTAKDASSNLCHLMRACFLLLAHNSSGVRWLDLPEDKRPQKIRLLEKTPRNSLNVPFLLKLFPDMRVIFLYRDARETVSSIMEAWSIGLSTGRFVTFRDLPGWDRKNWCLILPDGWQAMNGKSLAEIACFQWVSANQAILDDLQSLIKDKRRWMVISYSELVSDAVGTVKRLAGFIPVPFSGGLSAHASKPLPHSSTIVTAPERGKWERNKSEIEPLKHIYNPLMDTLKGATCSGK